MLHATYESIYYRVIPCPPRLDLSGVHPETSTRTDGMPVCVCVFVCLMLCPLQDLILSDHTHISRDQFIPAACLCRNNWREKLRDKRIWAANEKRGKESKNWNIWERRYTTVHMRILCVSVCVCVIFCLCLSTIFDPDQLTQIHGSLKVVVGGQLKMRLKLFN